MDTNPLWNMICKYCLPGRVLSVHYFTSVLQRVEVLYFGVVQFSKFFFCESCMLSLLTNIFLSQVIKYFLQYVLLDLCIFKLCICTYLAFSLFQNITNFFELPVWHQAFLSPFFWHRRVSACVSSTSEENLSLDFKLLGCLVTSGLL